MLYYLHQYLYRQHNGPVSTLRNPIPTLRVSLKLPRKKLNSSGNKASLFSAHGEVEKWQI